MKRKIALSGLILFLCFAAGEGRSRAAGPAPGFTISAPNVTMTNGFTTPVPFTLTSVNGFAGDVVVDCEAPTPPAGVREPVCYQGLPHAWVLTAGGTTTGNAALSVILTLTPGAGAREFPRSGGGAGLAVAGVLMLGLGWGSRKRFRHGSALAVAGMLVGLTGLGGCGSSPAGATLTPGTYVYTLTANETDSSNPATASTTVQVTVPAGILIPKNP